MSLAVGQDAATDLGDVLHADVCVIGAGPAGLTVATRVAEAGGDVLVLDAGSLPYDRHDARNAGKAVRDHLRGAQSLARGRTVGEPYYPLRLSRARGLGGSTNALLGHGLRGRPLDPIDFAARLGAAWPIRYEEMAEFVPAAEVLTGMRSGDESPVDWTPQPARLAGIDLGALVAAPFRHGKRDQFPETGLRIAQHGPARVVTSAVVVGFRTGAAGVESAAVVSPSGRQFHVMADVFVLAAGGIDNARLMLASRSLLYAMDAAAGNVGRFFMEHLHYVAGYLIPASPEAGSAVAALFGDPAHPRNWLTPADTLIRDEALLRVAVAAFPVHAGSLDPAVPAAGELARMLPFGPFGLRPRLRQGWTALRGLPRVAGAVAARLRHEERTVFALGVMSEQAPIPESRVVLGPRSDRLGLPLPELRWPVGGRDFRAAARTMELMAMDLAGAGIGEVRSLWDQGETRPAVVTGGWHHMGTTRMSADPETGVVDADCRVYGVDNLYVAGSSVFATGGFANPTLTLVALALRLARHIAA
jgi:choline dehydrogenase-like flavoprotein